MSTGEMKRGLAVTRKGSLLRAEVLRLRSRRLVRLLLLLGLVATIAVGVGESVLHARPDAQSVVAAKVGAAAQSQSCVDAARRDPLRDPNAPTDDLLRMCHVDYRLFLAETPFVLANDLPGAASALAGGMAVLLFVIGATSGGADWAAKTLPALLFWEPRRTRVLLTKLGVVVALSVVVAVGAQLLWTAMAVAITALRGSSDGKPADFWSQLLWLDLRGLLLVVLAGVAGYAAASVVRSTGAALTVAFVYLVVEMVARGFLLRVRPYLLVQNVTALLKRNGLDVYLGEGFVPGDPNQQHMVLHLSNLRAGVPVTVVVALLVLLATVLFRRRDLT